MILLNTPSIKIVLDLSIELKDLQFAALSSLTQKKLGLKKSIT